MSLKIQKDGKVVIAYRATLEEVKVFEEVQQALKRSNKSDLIRFLVSEAHEKILSQNAPVGANLPEVTA